MARMAQRRPQPAHPSSERKYGKESRATWVKVWVMPRKVLLPKTCLPRGPNGSLGSTETSPLRGRPVGSHSRELPETWAQLHASIGHDAPNYVGRALSSR